MTQKKRILIVDDDPDFSTAIQKILSSANYDVDVAGNVKDGMRAIDDKIPDLILLDVMMEKYDDGFNMCYDLKHDDRYRSIPVIIITAVTEVTGLKFNPETDGEYLDAEDYVQKPISAEALLDKVKRLI
ncbi:MAG: response regulator transcription factor [Proteobacteria bacterium]|jgi:two-component system alkaline phosphatase synthesis response regulator PhoP|nr:response regulator transcription factor [Pseudomonadota bacterium]